VRVPDELLKCVGFVCAVEHRDSENTYGQALATGFFVSVPCETPSLREQRWMYFVTARHVAADMQNETIFFLVNKVDGGVTDKVNSPDNRWTLHPKDPTADVAVIQVGIRRDADIIPIAVETIGTPERLQRLGIGLGDDTHTVGLFTPAPGVSRNMPIVRHGNISMMPSEQIQTELGYADVYLVEARSLGGLSGSPVFVRHTLVQKMMTGEKKEQLMFANGPGETLLGLMHGHWDINESDINKAYFAHDPQRGVNYGVAIVVPAIKIYETIYCEELVKLRREREEKTLKQMVPKADSARKHEAAFTQKDFESALKKVSRKITDDKK
jgi:hypothetical protein